MDSRQDPEEERAEEEDEGQEDGPGCDEDGVGVFVSDVLGREASVGAEEARRVGEEKKKSSRADVYQHLRFGTHACCAVDARRSKGRRAVPVHPCDLGESGEGTRHSLVTICRQT